MEQMLPSSVNYLDVLPKALPSEKTRKKFYSSNGRTFSPNQTIKINLESARSFLDPSNTYLEFDFINSTGQTCALDLGGAYNFIKNFRIHQAGNEIVRVNNVNRLMNAILIPGTQSLGIAGNDSIKGCTRYGNAVGAGNLNTPDIAGNTDGALLLGSTYGDDTDIAIGETIRLTMPLLFGLFSQTGTAKLLPLPLLNHPIELYFDICPLDEIGVFAGAAPLNWELLDVSVVADLVEVPRDVIGFMKELQMMHGGSLAIQGQSYEHNSGDIQPAAGNQTINIPSRKKSIKSVFFATRSLDFTAAGVLPATQTYTLSYGGQSSIGSFFIRAGALVMPQPSVQCVGNSAVAARREGFQGEQYNEFMKALGRFGKGIGSGLLSKISYGVFNGDNTDAAGGQQSPVSGDAYELCPFGFSLDAYQNEAIKAGLDTQTLSLEMQLNLELTANGGALQLEVHNIDIFTLYDVQYYINADGTITFED